MGDLEDILDGLPVELRTHETLRERLLQEGFRINGKIHEGASDVDVVESERVLDGAKVALKITWRGEDRSARELFEKEILGLKSLNHPNIIKLINFGTIEFDDLRGRTRVFHYLALELGEGTLEDAVGPGGPLPPSEAARIASSIAGAVEHAHGQTPRILHLDIKPANIVRVGATWKLIDFNILRFTADAGWGTEGYRSPQLKSSRPGRGASRTTSTA